MRCSDGSPHPLCVVECLEPRRLLASVPIGFTVTPVASGLSAPTAEDIAPDGRIFVAEQTGSVRIIQDGKFLAQPFLTLNVDSTGERGVDGIVLDPNFKTNHFVYVYYTTDTPTTHNRLSRFTANGNVAVPGSEKVLLDLNPLHATNHNGGGLHFGADGKLYVSVGENAVPANALSLANLLGKVLRINSDGSIPADNPFYNVASGNNRAIWAIGLRNPFSFAVQPRTGHIFINDVGQEQVEEIDVGKAGANYGWPGTEGPFDQNQFPNFTEPLFSYIHGTNDSLGQAIVGGTFYDPSTQQFPVGFRSQYFFADFGLGFIKVLNPATATASDFATGFSQPVDLDVAADGSLLLLEHTGAIKRISFPTVDKIVTINDIADSYVADGSSQTTNFGHANRLLVRSGSAGQNSTAYLRFDLNSFLANSKAALRLFGTLSAEGNGSVAVGVFGADNAWSENTITWNNRPAPTTSVLAQATITTSTAHWYTFDLTAYLQQQKQAGQNIVTLALQGMAPSLSTALFNSREAADGPQLVIIP
jgi:glucose/arabinose dehydrogenase